MMLRYFTANFSCGFDGGSHIDMESGLHACNVHQTSGIGSVIKEIVLLRPVNRERGN